MGDLEFDGDIENRSWSGGMARSLSLFEVTFMPWAFDSQIRPYRQIYHQVPVSKSSFFLQCTMKIWINYFLSMLPCDPQLSKEEGEPGVLLSLLSSLFAPQAIRKVLNSKLYGYVFQMVSWMFSQPGWLLLPYLWKVYF